MTDHAKIIDDFDCADKADVDRIVLRLYVAGTAHRSARAIERVKQVCEGCLPGRYTLEVIDLYHHPALAERDQIVALPTLIRVHPLPARRVVGDMTDGERILQGVLGMPSLFPDMGR